MCGLSFSGKSTFAALLVDALNAELISLDSINAERELYGGQGIPLGEWARTNDIAQGRAHAALLMGRNVIVDDTGSPRVIRDGWRKVAAVAGASFSLVWVQIDPERQHRRLLDNRDNVQRHDVTDEVMAAHMSNFEAPTNEDPLIIDAADTTNPAIVAAIARSIRRRAL